MLTELSVPKEERYFEDYKPGDSYLFTETATVSEEEIIAYAKAYDQQYFHLDPVAAKNSIYKGLIASGGQVIALTFRIFIKNFLPGAASLGAPGMDELRWLKPLRPNDVLRVRASVVDAKASKSRPDRGMVTSFVETLNQNDEVIMSYKGLHLMLRRPQKQG